MTTINQFISSLPKVAQLSTHERAALTSLLFYETLRDGNTPQPKHLIVLLEKAGYFEERPPA